MIKHVVLLSWKDGVTQEQIKLVNQGFSELRREIPEIKKYEYGPDVGIYGSNASYALVSEFLSERDFLSYVNKEAHQRFLNDIAGPILKFF